MKKDDKVVHSRDYSLDFLKVMATCGIVFHHFQQMTGARYPNFINFWNSWFNWGYLVEFFFMCSGFFMVHYIDEIYNSKKSLSYWFSHRLKRLLPMVCLSAIGYELIIYGYFRVTGENWYGIQVSLFGTILASFGIQHGWGFPDPMVNYPIWYVSVLLACYLIFYIVTALAKRLKCSPIYFYIFMVFLGCIIPNYSFNYPLINTDVNRGYYSFFSGLLLGCYLNKHVIGKKEICVSLFVIIFYSFLAINKSIQLQNNLAFILTFFLYPSIIVLFKTKLLTKLFSQKIWNILSNISFEVYLWHNPMIPLMYILMHCFNWNIDFSYLGSMFAFLAFSWAVGTFFYFFLEKPIQKKFKIAFI